MVPELPEVHGAGQAPGHTDDGDLTAGGGHRGPGPRRSPGRRGSGGDRRVRGPGRSGPLGGARLRGLAEVGRQRTRVMLPQVLGERVQGAPAVEEGRVLGDAEHLAQLGAEGGEAHGVHAGLAERRVRADVLGAQVGQGGDHARQFGDEALRPAVGGSCRSAGAGCGPGAEAATQVGQGQCGQRGAVGLPVQGAREAGHPDQRVGHHVLFRCLSTGHDNSLPDAVEPAQGRLDLLQFDPVATHLDL